MGRKSVRWRRGCVIDLYSSKFIRNIAQTTLLIL